MGIVPSLSPFSHAACRVETKKLPAFHIEKCGELAATCCRSV